MGDDVFEVTDNAAAGRLEIRLGGKVAFAEYRVLANGVLFPHTEVPPAFEGRDAGSALVRAGMALASARGLPVMPVCPFFAAYIARHPDLHAQLHPHYRRALGLEG